MPPLSKVAFGRFTRELNVHLDQLSYNEIIPAITYDAQGNELPHRPATLSLSTADVYRLLQPYLSVRFLEQFRAVTPLALYLVVFQLFILREQVQDRWMILASRTQRARVASGVICNTRLHLYFTGRMDQPHGGVIFMTRLSRGMEMHMSKVAGGS